MLTLADLRPGDIMFGPIGNTLPKFLPAKLRFMPGSLPVGFGQWLLARTSDEERYIDHVAVVVEAARPGLVPLSTNALDAPMIGPRIVQAMPSGAEEIEIGMEHWTSEYVYVRPAYSPYPTGVWSNQAERVADAARAYIGTPYSFLDYAAIAGLHAGIKNGPIRRYVTSSQHMICSQLAYKAMGNGGWHVFRDGRLPQDVMPVELYRKMLDMPGWFYHPDGDDGWRQCGPGTAYRL